MAHARFSSALVYSCAGMSCSPWPTDCPVAVAQAPAPWWCPPRSSSSRRAAAVVYWVQRRQPCTLQDAEGMPAWGSAPGAAVDRRCSR